ncbi:hypothetical protein, partial [Anaerosporobacter sp.]
MLKDYEEFRHKLISLLKNDKLYDKRSLIWENDDLLEIDDDMDSNVIQEGRLGEFPNKRIQTKMGIVILLPLVRDNKTLDEIEDKIDDYNIYQLRSENRFLKLVKLLDYEYQNRIQSYDETKDFYKIPIEDNGNYLLVYDGL